MNIATTIGAARGSSGTKPVDVSSIALTAPPTPADKAPAPGTQPVPPRFAELLRQNRAEAAAPAALPPPAQAAEKDEDTASEPVASTASAGNDAKAPAANAAKARAAAAKAPSGPGTAGATARPPADTADATDAPADGAIDRDATTPLSPGVIDPGATAALAAQGARAPGRGADVAEDGTDDRSTAADPRRRGASHARGAVAIETASQRAPSLVDASREQALKAGSDAGLQAALVAGSESAETALPHRLEHAGDSFAASLAAASTARAADAPLAAAPNVAVTVPTPLDSPDFATAFGVQVSVLAKDGVQRAELHLNPTEMGPVSIHITLDGNAARVDFGADVAPTRQAIERGLPELASALRDAGFTLAGGGVSAHAGSGRSPSGENESTPRGTRADARAGAVSPAAVIGGTARLVRGVAAGGVDLYA